MKFEKINLKKFESTKLLDSQTAKVFGGVTTYVVTATSNQSSDRPSDARTEHDAMSAY